MYPIRFENLYYNKIWGGRDFENFRDNMPEGEIGEIYRCTTKITKRKPRTHNFDEKWNLFCSNWKRCNRIE